MGLKEGTEKMMKSFVNKAVKQLWEQLLPNMDGLFNEMFKGFKKNTPSVIELDWIKWCDKWVKSGKMPQDTADMLKKMTEAEFPLDFISIIMARIQLFKGEIEAMTNIYGLDRQYTHMAATTPNPAPIDNLVRSMIIDPGRSTENRAELAKHGFDKTQIDNIILSYYRTIDEGTIRIEYLRSIITETQMIERMRELGYTDERTAEIVPTWQIIPGPMDLLTMVAHEAFEPELYKKMGLDAEFPSDQEEWLKKQGIDSFWAHKYWISHWQQPSIGMGYEMLHRGQIDTDELNMLYKTVELPPYWRDKLTAVAYNPFTRVDVRRMHDLGVLSDEELIRSYMDLGYDEEKALKMAQFTVKYNASHEKELTRGAIISSYEKGLIDRTDSLSLLVAQDYSHDLADYYLTLSDYKIEQETQDLLFDNIKDQYLLGVMTASTAKTKLSSMGIKANKVDALMANWTLEQYKYENLPSKAELTDMLLNNTINEDQFRQTMSRHGYNPMFINWYLEDIEKSLTGSRNPSKADWSRWLKNGFVEPETYYTSLKEMGYNNQTIYYYFRDAGYKKAESTTFAHLY